MNEQNWTSEILVKEIEKALAKVDDDWQNGKLSGFHVFHMEAAVKDAVLKFRNAYTEVLESTSKFLSNAK